MENIKKIKTFLMIRLILSFVVAAVGVCWPNGGFIATLLQIKDLTEDAEGKTLLGGLFVGLALLIFILIIQIRDFAKLLKIEKMKVGDAAVFAKRANKHGGAFWTLTAVGLNALFELANPGIYGLLVVLFIVTWVLRRVVKNRIEDLLLSAAGNAAGQIDQSEQQEEPKPESKPRSNASKFD